MSKFSSHREILELWSSLPPIGQLSWFYSLAREINQRVPVTVSYYTVRRWWERDSIPLQFHSALVAAARARGFVGVTHKALADIKGQELHLRLVTAPGLREQASAC